MRRNSVSILLAAGIVALTTTIAVATGYSTREPQERFFTISARQYAYSPSTIKVNKGDRIHIRLLSEDVIHGFFLEGYDIDAEIDPGRVDFKVRHPSIPNEKSAPTREIIFTANHAGKFHYRCSHTCGYLHPFMLGEFVVEPNYPYRIAVGGTVGLLLVGFLFFFSGARRPSRLEPDNRPPRGSAEAASEQAVEAGGDR